MTDTEPRRFQITIEESDLDILPSALREHAELAGARGQSQRASRCRSLAQALEKLQGDSVVQGWLELG